MCLMRAIILKVAHFGYTSSEWQRFLSQNRRIFGYGGLL